MKFDIPLFYSKKLFNKEEFLFYLIKNDYIKVFKNFYNDLNIDFKNKEHIFLVKKMFNFAIKNKNKKIHDFLFSKTVDICHETGFFYDTLSYLIKKGMLNNPSNVNFYKKEISYSIRFYNSPFCRYKRKLYLEAKNSYPIFMKDYDFLISYLIKNLNEHNIDNILTLHSIFYYETSFGCNNDIINFCVDYNKPELAIYYASHKLLNNSNTYYKDTILKKAFRVAINKDNFEFVDYFHKKEFCNLSFYENDTFRTIIRNESVLGLTFLNKHPHLFFNVIINAYNNSYFDYLFHFTNFENIEFFKLFFDILKEIYEKSFILQNINHRFSQEQFDILSDIFFQISNEAIVHNRYEKIWNVFYDKFSFDCLTNVQIDKLLDKYYKNKNIMTKIHSLVEKSMKSSHKKEKAIESLNLYMNANKINNF